ncbi:Catabolite control protein A [compost metagenome]
MDNSIKEIIIKEYIDGKKIDAIFGATDVITTRTLGILAELQIEVPMEVAVIGFSNTQIAASLNPALSTVVQPATEIGEIATKKLIDTINQTRPIHEFETIELPTQLVVRKSSL